MSLSQIAKTSAMVVAVVFANLMLVGLLGELIVRLSYDPFDYLEPDRVDDEILSFRITPGSAGHDAWGFRNADVPETTDILTLGDSWTYGSAARASESWPSWLQRDSGQSVYNMGVYGFGPTDYLYLLETRGLQLEPKVVVLGFSYLTDFYDSFRRAYGRDYWSRFREGRGYEPLHPPPHNTPDGLNTRWKSTRNWLRRRSLLYQLAERGPIGRTINEIAGQRKTREVERCLLATEGPFPTFVDPKRGMKGVDLEQPEVRVGLQISQEILLEIAATSRENGARFVVALFPTKERVHEGRTAASEFRDCDGAFELLMEREARVDHELKSFLMSHGIEFVDTLPALRRESQKSQIFFRSPDLHPNGAGYRVIGRVVADYLASEPPQDPQKSGVGAFQVRGTR